jgi:hypothetical protein
MSTTVETAEKRSHSEQQAWAQLSSICELVANLTREGAAREYVKDMLRERCADLLAEAGIQSYDTENTEELQEAVAVNIGDNTITPDDFEWDEEEARERIQEDALSVQVRGDWHTPGDEDAGKPTEFEILLCTGGPAVRIRGDLDEHLQPDRAYIEHQDWGTPWQQIFGLSSEQQEALLTYCQQFYFGE